jgi:hypothetical protein
METSIFQKLRKINNFKTPERIQPVSLTRKADMFPEEITPVDDWKVSASDDQKIILTPNVLAKLHLMEQAAHGNEFSGFGFVDIIGKNLVVYEVVLMDLGTYGWTEFDPKKVLPLLDRPDNNKMKLWFHKHPVGNGIPGDHNWSGTDQRTIRNEPLGGIPELVKWSASIVKTPYGWVGRIDNYTLKKTIHVGVEFEGMQEVNATIRQIVSEKKVINGASAAAIIIDEAPHRMNKNVSWTRENLYNGTLFDVEDYEEELDDLDENLINDFFYSLEDEVQLQLRDILDELDKVAKTSMRLASRVQDKNLCNKLDELTDQINRVYGRLTVVSDQLIEQVNATRDSILEFMEG